VTLNITTAVTAVDAARALRRSRRHRQYFACAAASDFWDRRAAADFWSARCRRSIDQHMFLTITSRKPLLFVYLQIPCKRGSAAVVRTTCCSYGKGQILHFSRAETTVPINTKFLMIDYLGDIKRIAKCGCYRF